MQPTIIRGWEAKRSGAAQTIKGVSVMGAPINVSGIRRIYRAGQPDAGTGTFPVIAEHGDGRIFHLE